jgi:polyisoprenyl-phosphate glycosyltransferase
MVKYSIVVPAYNEEKNIPILYKKINLIFNKFGGSWELIFINDGSKDKTLDVLKKLSKKDRRVKYLDLSRNFGHQAALSAGLDYAKGSAIVSMDCDMQDPPELIIDMIKKWKKGYEVVYARRKNRNDKFFKKYSALAYYKLLDRFSHTKIPRNVGDFRLVDRKVLDQLNAMKEKSRYLRGLVAWLGYKFTYVDFDRPERTEGETGYTLTKMMRLAMDGILNFSMFPLKVGLLMGMISITIGSLALIYMIVDVLAFSTVYELFKWLSVILLMFMGFSFMLIWILGEYIGRIYDEVKGRPLYVVRENGNI